TYSGLTGDGIADLWMQITAHREKMMASGELARKRREQQVKWMWAMLEDRLYAQLRANPALKSKLPAMEQAVAAGTLSPMVAVEDIAQALRIDEQGPH
ncbi:MAG: methylmalonyl Co-A mutase-associated GTPase MeaB, partial [Pseudomonadota bacterium]|nr:methylmalonyl Co-A mutase-associated GTPase MeaB [Pseudomonadota bacterium]